MKFKITKEWLQKRADRDEKAEVSTGALSFDRFAKEATALCQTQHEHERLATAFGKLLRFRRCEMRFSITQLAQKADIDEKELEEAENNVHYTPEPRTVHQLAKALRIPEKKLMQLSGHLVVTDSEFVEQAERFAASAKRVDVLTDDEHQALKEFVKYLAEHH